MYKELIIFIFPVEHHVNGRFDSLGYEWIGILYSNISSSCMVLLLFEAVPVYLIGTIDQYRVVNGYYSGIVYVSSFADPTPTKIPLCLQEEGYLRRLILVVFCKSYLTPQSAKSAV